MIDEFYYFLKITSQINQIMLYCFYPEVLHMQNETASTAFLEFGSVYKESLAEKETGLIRQTRRINAQRYLSQFLVFDSDIYIEVQSGIGILLVSHDPINSTIMEFAGSI